jgi:hypothetical protein
MIFVAQDVQIVYPPAVDKRAVGAVEIPDRNCVVWLVVINLGVISGSSTIPQDDVILQLSSEDIRPRLEQMLAALFIARLDNQKPHSSGFPFLPLILLPGRQSKPDKIVSSDPPWLFSQMVNRRA